MDGLAGIRIFFGDDVTGVVFTSHGPSEFGSLLPVGLLVEEGSGLLGLHGRGESGCTGNKGRKDNNFGLYAVVGKKKERVSGIDSFS